MLLNTERAVDHIVSWLKDYAKDNGKKSFVVEVNTNICEWVTALLCKKTLVKTTPVGAIGSSHSDLIEKALGITPASFDPVAETGFDKFIENLDDFSPDLNLEYHKHINSFLNYIASGTDGVIAGNLSKEVYDGRFYAKGCEGDILPLADLYSDEIGQIFNYLYPEELGENIKLNNNLPGSLMTEEVAWAFKEDAINQIISSNTDPTKSRDWGRYTSKQRKIIARLNQIEKLTRHKKTNSPVCNLRNIPGLVRKR